MGHRLWRSAPPGPNACGVGDLSKQDAQGLVRTKAANVGVEVVRNGGKEFRSGLLCSFVKAGVESFTGHGVGRGGDRDSRGFHYSFWRVAIG